MGGPALSPGHTATAAPDPGPVSRPPRCLLPTLDDLRPGARAELPRDQRHHLSRVLRLDRGAPVELVDGRGGLARARWEGDGRLAVTELCPRRARPERRLWLAVAPPRPSRLDWLVEKAAELGVARLTLVSTRHAARDVGAARLERLARKAREALEQCRRLHALALDGPRPLTDLLSAAEAGDAERPRALWVAHPPDGAALDGAPPPVPDDGPLLAVVGPEGGLAADELEQLERAGARRVALGRGVLRVETAALALAAWHALGEPAEA